MKSLAIIQDLTALGGCSLAAAIPITAAMGIRPLPIASAVLTCQTGLPGSAMTDLTPMLPQYPAAFAAAGVVPDGILTGFAASSEQLDAFSGLVNALRNPRTLLAVDPVMGDDGRAFPFADSGFIAGMRTLALEADLILPNLTELCLLCQEQQLCGEQCPPEPAAIAAIARKFCHQMSRPEPLVAVTGIPLDNGLIGSMLVSPDDYWLETNPGNGVRYNGTGDIFAAVLCSGLLNGTGPPAALKKAVSFTAAAVAATPADADPRLGVAFEAALYQLSVDS